MGPVMLRDVGVGIAGGSHEVLLYKVFLLLFRLIRTLVSSCSVT